MPEEAGPTTLAIEWEIGPGIDLASPHSVSVRSSPLADTLYIADTGNNRVLCLQLSRSTTPEATWSAFKAQMLSRELEIALTYFVRSSVDPHRDFFNTLGTQASAQIINEIGPLSMLTSDSNTATYKFLHSVQGMPVTFFVQFFKEDGKWKISEF